MNRLWAVAAVFALVVFTGNIVMANDRQGAAPLETLVQEALANNPDLLAAEARWQLYASRPAAARTLADPVLGVAFNNYPVDSLDANDTPMTGKVIKLSQKFPFPGKLAARGELAEQQALWFRAAYEDARLALTGQVREGWYALYFFDRAIEAAQKNLIALDDFIRLTETNYAVGKGLQQDVLKAQVERSRLMDRLFTLEQQRDSALAELNTLLNRHTGEKIGPLEDFEITEVEPDLDDLQHRSEQDRPMYAAFTSLIERYQVQRKLARLDYRPDFTVGAAYTIRERTPGSDGTDFVGLEFGMTLPVYRQRQEAALAEADSGLRMAHRQYEDFRGKVHRNIHNAYVGMKRNRKQIDLYRGGIIPQASQSFEAALSGYQVGKVDFLTLLDNLTTLYRYQIDYYRVLTDYQRSVARLAAESGASFDMTTNLTMESR